ncbi:MAG: hypothetical protein ACXWIM_21385 [Burkholderiales bacterium]
MSQFADEDTAPSDSYMEPDLKDGENLFFWLGSNIMDRSARLTKHPLAGDGIGKVLALFCPARRDTITRDNASQIFRSIIRRIEIPTPEFLFPSLTRFDSIV